MALEIREDLVELFAGGDPFERALALEGDVYRDVKGRRTLRFEHRGRGYFIKVHSGVGWGEIVKNLLMLKTPVIGASNEYRAIRALEAIGISTLSIAAFGRWGINPASQQSFLVTEELPPSVTLEDHCGAWLASPPSLVHKRTLIRAVAAISRAMHGNGINHRDYYLCHFHLDTTRGTDEPPQLYLIDLHRTQIRHRVPRRWRLKDIAGLYFSALDIGLTRRDLMAFMTSYADRPLREALGEHRAFWRQVERKALRLYRKVHGSEWQPGGGVRES